MIIACPACATRYAVPDTAIGVDGRTVRCAKCRHSWFQDGPAVAMPARAVPPPAEAPNPAATPTPAPPPPSPPPAAAQVEMHAPAERAVPVPEPAAPEPAPQPDQQPYPQTSAGAAPETRIVPPLPEATLPEAPLPETPLPQLPLPQAPLPASPAPIRHDPLTSSVMAAAEGITYYDEDRSSFDFEPPFRGRRNPAKMWTMAAVLFAVISLGLVGAVAWYGLPDWVPFSSPTFAEAQPGLVLDFPARRQDRRTLPNGTEFFGVSGTITNVGQARRSVPSILIVLRDHRERIVYSSEVVPPEHQLAPGESVTINEALTDVPKTAKSAEIGWKPG